MTTIRYKTDNGYLEITPSELFRNEILLIKDKSLIKYVCHVLNNDVWRDNYVKPASSTGKYHPSFSNGRYGLIKHTKALIKVLNSLQDAYPDLSWDHIYVAAILHDLCKYSPNRKFTNSNHADLMADKILRDQEYYPDLKIDLLAISILVRYHMGRYDDHIYAIPNELLSSKIEFEVNLVHISDMIVSREWYGNSNKLFVGGN